MKEKELKHLQGGTIPKQPSGTPGMGAVSSMHWSGEQRHDVTGYSPASECKTTG